MPRAAGATIGIPPMRGGDVADLSVRQPRDEARNVPLLEEVYQMESVYPRNMYLSTHDWGQVLMFGFLALNCLAIVAPDWLRAHSQPEWVERDVARLEDARTPLGDEARHAFAELIGADGASLLSAIYEAAAPGFLQEIPAFSRLNHDGGWGGEAHSAGAGHDQDGDCGHHGGDPRLTGSHVHADHVRAVHPNGGVVAGDDEPGDEGEQGDGEDDGHKYGSHAVRQALDGGLGSLRLLHHADNAGEDGIGSNSGRAHAQQAVLVDGRTDHLVALTLLHRHALAGDHRLIDQRAAGEDHAVDGNLLAGPHDQIIADTYVLDGQLDLVPIAQCVGGTRLQTAEFLQRFVGLPLRAGLQVLAQENQGDNQRGGIVECCLTDKFAEKGSYASEGEKGDVMCQSCQCKQALIYLTTIVRVSIIIL